MLTSELALPTITTMIDSTTFVGLPVPKSGSFFNLQRFSQCQPRAPSSVSRRQQLRGRKILPTACLDPFTEEEKIAQRNLETRKKQLEKEMEQLEGTSLKWSEINFPTVEDELNAIAEYVREEEIDEGDCWPTFLRACAYEARGQTQQALAQLSEIKSPAGLSLVPNLWERRAHNTFKAGDVKKADALFDVSIRILTDAVGNGLHFSHWFDENFANFIPRHNGPAFSVQRGICKYCVRKFDSARGSIIPGVIVRDLGCEHSVLWLIAAIFRMDKPSILKGDLDIIAEYCENDVPNDLNDTLRLCIDLYFKVARDLSKKYKDEIEALKNIAEQGSKEDSLIAQIYLALFYDSIQRDESERDKWLDKIVELPSGPACVDALDFAYHAAKSRFGAVETILNPARN